MSVLTRVKKINFHRGITSYGKVQAFIASVIRTRPIFISKRAKNKSLLLNVGCGPNSHPDYINLDYYWHNKIDICWNIEKKPYPLPDASLEGIYTEHCLEHIAFESFQANIAEFYRLLKPGGVLRIVMPDGGLYFELYERRRKGENVHLPHEEGYITAMARINALFRNYGHRFIYDFETVHKILESKGFKEIMKESYMKGRDQRLLIDMQWRSDESLYVEASK